MTTLIIVAAAIVLGVLAWIIFSGKKQKHHLDDLHITSEGKAKNKQV